MKGVLWQGNCLIQYDDKNGPLCPIGSCNDPHQTPPAIPPEAFICRCLIFAITPKDTKTQRKITIFRITVRDFSMNDFYSYGCLNDPATHGPGGMPAGDFMQPPADAGPAPSRRGPSHLGELLPSPDREIGTDGIGIAGNNARHMMGE